MKYFFLVAILIGLGAGLFYELEEYKNFTLITDSWSIPKEEIGSGLSLVQVKNSDFQFYKFSASNGFIEIVKQLWLLATLFIGAIVILLPFSIYVLKASWNIELSEARETQKEAKEDIKKAETDLIKAKNKHLNECNLKVENAYQKQLNIVHNELSERMKGVEKREKIIDSREMEAFKMKELANKELSQYRSEFQELKSGFKEKEALLIMQRDHAIDTMNARRMRFEKKVKKLKQELKQH
jgi:hypothetical protein